MSMIFRVLLCLLLLPSVAKAADYSYIFIQGDKQTPFYVKLEGQMMPRLGKNYCILPNMDEGTIHLEILFQQNIFPAQKFTVKVPAAGGRGFVLQQINDQQFALYDLATQNRLMAGNKEEDDIAGEPATAVDDPALAWGNTTAEDLQPTKPKPVREPELPVFDGKKEKVKKASDKKSKPVKETVEEVPKQGRFIDDIELNTEAALPAFEPAPSSKATKKAASVNASTVTKESKKKKPQIVEDDENLYEGSTIFKEEAATRSNTSPEEAAGGIPNTDCGEAMTNEEFEDFAIKIMDRADDDAQLKYLRKVADKNCFTTEQVRILAKNMETQSARLEVVKMLYPRVVDQGSYPVLENLFNTSFLKKKFKELIGGE